LLGVLLLGLGQGARVLLQGQEGGVACWCRRCSFWCT
jgi:hypothetical protein